MEIAGIVEACATALKVVFVTDGEENPRVSHKAIEALREPTPEVSARVITVDPRHEA
jgi:hypothetical protein